MTSPYIPISEFETNAHTNMGATLGYDGIYPSGEGHFSNFGTSTDPVPTPLVPQKSIFNFDNLDSPFSNATESYIIDDFTIFNLYRHNTSSYTVNASSLLNIGTDNFNIYSVSFRTWNLQ